MGTHGKLLWRILEGRADADIGFSDLRALLLHLGFEERTRGSHHIFRRADVEERINLQRQGNKAKPYQVRQVRAVVLRYRLEEVSDV
jgi:predicted RNA binding protein YcfA (HicA-like mRNA interferase family)